MADAYDRMTTAQLEAEAASRYPAVDLAGASNNAERAQLLREDDATSPTVEDAVEDAVAAADDAAVEFAESDEDVAAYATGEETTPEPRDEKPDEVVVSEVSSSASVNPAPYVGDEDLAARLEHGGGEQREV